MAKSKEQKLEEVLKRISESIVRVAPTIYHPSECVNQKMDPSAVDEEESKNNETIFHVINGYHIYCKPCQYHFYSNSKFNDINSFFQAHINSIDHIWNRGSCNWNETKPILQWEKWLYTGFCVICNKSGIEAFVIDDASDIVNIIGQHASRSYHQKNCKYLETVGFDEKMAKLDIFSKIYIVKVPKHGYFCRVCSFKIEREALIEYHLNSKQHCQKFCDLFKKEFNIKLENRDLELDVEELARRMKELPAFKSDFAITCKKNLNHVKESNCAWDSEMKFLTRLQLGFSPSAMDKAFSVANEDLKKATFCALCQEYPDNMNRHLSSNSHQLRVMVFQQCSSVRPISLIDYLPSSQSHSSPAHLNKYKKYKLLLKKQGLDFGIPYKPEYAQIDLNEESFDDESNYKAIYDRIKRIEEDYLTAKKECKNVKANKSKSIERKKSDIPGLKVMKKPPGNVTVNGNTDEKKTEREESSDIIITAEKLNLNEFSTLWLFIDRYLEGINAVDESKRSKCHKKGDKGNRCSCYYEEKSTLFQQLRNNRYFILTFEKWRCLGTLYYVCVLCGSGYECLEKCFRHMKKRNHIHRYKEMNNGNLKPISPSEYSINTNEKACVCKSCGEWVCEIKFTDFSIPLVAKSISLHETKCSRAKKNPFPVPVNEYNADSLTAELKRILMIGSDNSKTSDSPRVDRDDVSGENACTVKESKQIAVKEDENCVEKPGERKIGNAKSVKQEGSLNNTGNRVKESKKEVAHATKSEKFKDKNSAEAPPRRKESILKQNLKNFIRHCGSGLAGFLCAICLENDTMSALDDHLKSETHMANETFIRIRWFVQLGFCKFCKLLLLGTSDMFRQHYISAYHADREGNTSGKKNLTQTLIPETIDLLVVKGMPEMPREEKERCLRILLTPFGSIKRVFVRKNYSEVLFFDQRVVANILAVEKFMTDKSKALNFFLKRITRKVEIAMNSSEIYILGHGKIKVFVSCLVNEADSRMASANEKEKEEKLCESLQKVISSIYPDCKCFKFGSRVTGLIVGDCDLDVFLDYGNVYYAEDTERPENQSRIVRKVATALKASKHFGQVSSIAHCRVPIVTCVHISTNIHCDISFKNGLSCENTNLIKFMISIDDRAKGVILFLKYWTKCNSLHGRPYFSSYALTMFVFFYLQQEPNPVLPTVEFLKSCYTEPDKVIGEWDCGFTTDKELIPKTKNSDSVVQLILGFFNFCNTFNFSENVISPLTGKALSKEIIQNMAKGGLPPPYEKYKSKISPGNYGRKESICIMDPFDLDHNLTKVFPQLSFERFLYLCRLSSNLLSNSLQSKYFDHLYNNSVV